MEPITAVLVGAGQRGRYVYSAYARAHPDKLRLVGVIEPDRARRSTIADIHAIPDAACFDAVSQAVDLHADAWIVASPDRHHHNAVRAALEHGNHVLVEKPIAASMGDVVDLVTTAASGDGILAVGHVLRYTPFFRAINEIVTGDRLGDIVTVRHTENVAAWHMAHSFVRGNWARSAESTPMIVQKCCHDFDILGWNLGSSVVRLNSEGSLFHFRPGEAPPGAAARCTDPCSVEDCPFDARRLYLDEANVGWPVHVITDDLSLEGRYAALRTGPYGRCVYGAGSDVVDHQTVTMVLESGACVILTMHGHSHEEARTMRYDGTRATLRAVFGGRQEIEIIDHATGRVERIRIPDAHGGHGGGDRGLIDGFLSAIREGRKPLTSVEEGLESHFLAFAAEEARLTGATIDMARYRRRFDA